MQSDTDDASEHDLWPSIVRTDMSLKTRRATANSEVFIFR